MQTFCRDAPAADALGLCTLAPRSAVNAQRPLACLPIGGSAGGPHASPGRQPGADAGIHAQPAGHGAEHQWGAPRLCATPLWAAHAPAAAPSAAATAAAPPWEEPTILSAGCGHGLHHRGRAPAGRGHGLGHGQGRARQVRCLGAGYLCHAGLSNHLCCHLVAKSCYLLHLQGPGSTRAVWAASPASAPAR